MEIKQITAEYRDHMGSDLSVVNAARASFGKDSEWLNHRDPNVQPYDNQVWQAKGNQLLSLKKADASLINFLASGYRSNEWADFLDQIKNAVLNSPPTGIDDNLTALMKEYKNKAQHWAPFAHPHITIRIQIPIFLARQFVKHQVGGVWSEESRRYLSDMPEVWMPDKWHTRPEDIKQGSGDLIEEQDQATAIAAISTNSALGSYNYLIGAKVAPEEARIVLPLNMMTTVVWTGSLLFWVRVFNLRADSHAQLAAQELAKLIAGIIRPLYPVSWDALT